MASNYVLERTHEAEGVTHELAFAGDGVRLAGQIDYPSKAPVSGVYPLIVVLPHAGSTSRHDYDHYLRMALNAGYAIFRWDKRGTGRSGAGVRGSVVEDAVNAYDTALHQPHINYERVVILAQGEGTVMLGDNYGLFGRIRQPDGVILVGNMLDPDEVLAINTPLMIVTGDTDWNDWKIYARAACAAHNKTYNRNASYYVARNANRMLKVNQGGSGPFHFGAEKEMTDWLLSL